MMKVYEALKEMIENKKTIKAKKKTIYGGDWFYKLLITDIGSLIVHKFGEDGSWAIGCFSISGEGLDLEYEIVENTPKGEIK
jgi:hypothetical protein